MMTRQGFAFFHYATIKLGCPGRPIETGLSTISLKLSETKLRCNTILPLKVFPSCTMAQIRALAQKLAASASDLSDELESRGLAEYSFDNPNAPIDLPLLSAPGSAAQAELISAAEELLRLAHGPLTYLNRYQDVVSEPYAEMQINATDGKS
jgi:hypothetical protein